MPFSNFNSQIFQSQSANILCNKLVEAVRTEFSVAAANSEFAFTGCAARHFQVQSYYDSVSNIVFVTSDADIYEYLSENIATIINLRKSISYVDRIKSTTSDGYALEVWFSENALNVSQVKGITMQDENDLGFYGSCVPNGPQSVLDDVPLILSDNQTYNPGTSQLYQQAWEFNPSRVIQNWTVGQNGPADINIATKIKSYSNDNSYSTFSEIQIELISNRGQGNGLIADFFEASINNSATYDLENNPLVVTTVLTFVNFSLIDAGSYNSTIDFNVTGLDSRTGARGFLETIRFPIALTVISDSAAYTEPRNLAYIHTIDEALPAPQNLFVNIPGEYTLSYSKIFSITGPNMVDESTKKLTIKRTSGVQTFPVYVNRLVEGEGDGFQEHAITIKHSSGTLIVPVSISVAPTREIRVNPKQFEFEAIIGVEEAEEQSIQIVSPLPYTYEIPQWLSVSGNLGQTFTGTVKPSPSENFSPGTYEEEIILTSDEGTVRIPVTYKVSANSFTELLPNKVNFTKDVVPINLSTKIVGVYLEVTFNIKSYDFDGNEKLYEYIEHYPIFNGKAEFFPGELMHNVMSSIKTIDRFIPLDLEAKVNQPFKYYKPSVLDLKMVQKAYANDVEIKAHELTNLSFVKGTMPVIKGDDVAIMLSEYPIRVTPNSFGMLNFLKRSGIHTIDIFVNGRKEESINHDTLQDSLFGMVLSFKSYKPGDLVFVHLDDDEGGSLIRKFYVLPENKESYHMAWVNENEQIEILEFTGSLSIDSTYERITNTVYDKLVEITEILETKKTQPVKANTGWILKDNHVIIDSLIRSKRAWLFLPGTDYKVPMVPVTKKMSNSDTDRALYAYDVEFIINPENDAEIYPR